MAKRDLSLLDIERGLVIAPAGCGKTQLIANALRDHDFDKPILVPTHTNSGVAALRGRLDKAGVSPSAYRLATIHGWAIRLISTYPTRSGYNAATVEGQRPNYPAIRAAAWGLLKAGHVNDIVAATYSRPLVDEYQDCSNHQHAIVYRAARVLPTCVVGDPVQAIFGFGDDALADWGGHVCKHFPVAGELTHPWRWVNADAEELGQWLLDLRKRLLAGQSIDLRSAPAAVTWIELDGSKGDYAKLLQAGRVRASPAGSVLIIGESTNPASQQKFASETPGAVTVESVDLRDLVTFARTLDLSAPNALRTIAEFAERLMTNVGTDDLVRRAGIISRGTSRKEPSDVERSAIAFENDRCHRKAIDLLVEFNKDAGVRVYRPGVFRACIRALELCCGPENMSFHDAAIRIREQGRVLGRALPRRAVGSTLLLKGLESEVAVVLDADSLNARNLYVAMTRGSKRLIVCARKPVLKPNW